MADTNLGQGLGWEDEAKVQESEFVLLDPGVYDYQVVRFERGRFDGSKQMAACNVAKLTLHCTSPQTGMSGDVFVNLMLNTKVMWRITQFFKSCGLIPADAQQGDSLPMGLFNHVMGRTGKVKLKHRTWQDKTYNDVDEFVKPEPAPAQQSFAAPPTPAPAQGQWGGSFGA